ncbi:MAG: GNAT family N-acetyltransferase [Chloroflexi bacterium]|nr:GNAT family N-acetyltransferase [Chloroflexota bacterium]
MNFDEALKQAYLANPAQVLPNACWKTSQHIAGSETVFACSADGKVTRLELWQGNRLLAAWDANRSRMGLPAARMESMSFALLHDDYIGEVGEAQFSSRKAYFRLTYTYETAPRAALLPQGFRFKNVDPDQEAHLAAALIDQCYDDIKPGAETVRQWTHLPVFSADLWVWIWDQVGDRPAGLGIAEFDPEIGEGSLEWIQVLPEYRHKGLGHGLVRELICRLEGRARFVTVSGEMNKLTHPEHLYRTCGFTGEDVWWVLER